MSNYIGVTVTIRPDQDQALIKMAAQRQLKTGQKADRSKILRELLDQVLPQEAVCDES